MKPWTYKIDLSCRLDGGQILSPMDLTHREALIVYWTMHSLGIHSAKIVTNDDRTGYDAFIPIKQPECLWGCKN